MLQSLKHLLRLAAVALLSVAVTVAPVQAQLISGVGGSSGSTGTVTTITAGTNITLSSGATCTTTCTVNATGSLASTFVQETTLSSTNATSVTITFPQTTASSGNTAFMIVATDGSAAVTTPAGWTVDINQVAASFSRILLLHKTTASDTSATFTTSGATSYGISFFEMSGSHALDASSLGATTNTSILPLPAITPSAGSMVFGVAAEVANAGTGSATPAASPVSPLWNTISVLGSSAQQRLLFGHVYVGKGAGASMTPPPINNQAQALFGSGGVAYASFSIL